MSRRVPFLLFLVLAAAPAGFTASTPEPSSPDNAKLLGRGQQIAGAVGAVTGTAVSPLLGVCAMGAYDYFRTPQAERSQLSLYASPKFWIPIAALLILILIKDTVGGFAPLVKKPLDALEILFLNKASLVLVVLPVLFDKTAKVFGMRSAAQLLSVLWTTVEPVAYAAQNGVSGHIGAGGEWLTWLAIIIGMAATVSVWLVGHALDMLGLLIPIPFVDLALKCFRVGIFAVIALTTLIDRKAGLVISMVLIAVCLMLVPWAFRLVVFGTLFAWDLVRLVFGGDRASTVRTDALWAIAAAGVQGVPKRSLGKLARARDGSLEFRAHWLGLRKLWPVRLSDCASYEIGRGLVYPQIISPRANAMENMVMFRLLPRYRGSEELIRTTFGFSGIRDTRLSSGLREAWHIVTGRSETQRG